MPGYGLNPYCRDCQQSTSIWGCARHAPTVGVYASNETAALPIGSVDRPGVMTEWVLGDAFSAAELFGTAVAEPETATPERHRAPRARTRRRHDGRLRKLCQGRA